MEFSTHGANPQPLKHDGVRAVLLVCPSSVDLETASGWSDLPNIPKIAVVSSLTAAYNFCEHRPPVAVLVAQVFTTAEEFSAFAALLTTLAIPLMRFDPASAGSIPKAVEDARVPYESKVQHFGDDTTKTGMFVTSLAATSHGQRQPSYDPNRIILIGSSTGGVDALLRVLPELPVNCPPTLVVQHTGAGYSDGLVRLFASSTKARVTGALDGAPLKAGHIYFPKKDGCHMTVTGRVIRRIAYQRAEAGSGHCPSVDQLFLSALPFARTVSAAILTGMGKDGSLGLRKLRDAGARTIVQDQRSSLVYGMPKAAVDLGGAERQLPIEKIAAALLTSCWVDHDIR